MTVLPSTAPVVDVADSKSPTCPILETEITKIDENSLHLMFQKFKIQNSTKPGHLIVEWC
jgi:hypothetical protein